MLVFLLTRSRIRVLSCRAIVVRVFLSCVGARAPATDAVGCGMSALISVSNFSWWDAAWRGRHGLLEYDSYAE